MIPQAKWLMRMGEEEEEYPSAEEKNSFNFTSVCGYDKIIKLLLLLLFLFLYGTISYMLYAWILFIYYPISGHV